MPSEAWIVFETHIRECHAAIAIYDHLDQNAGFRADFNLRFVWIAAVSAMDHYVSQVILERATFSYGNNLPLQRKLLTDGMTFSSALALKDANPIDSVLIFKENLEKLIRFKSFQHPDKIVEGLSYIWPEKHKWQYLASELNIDISEAKRKLSGIVDRRNLIAHNGDYDEALGRKLCVSKSDAEEVVSCVGSIVQIIDKAVAR